MSDELEGMGSAEDASVSTAPPAAPHDDREHLDMLIESREVKVQKLREHLAGAEEALADAKAARDAHGEA